MSQSEEERRELAKGLGLKLEHVFTGRAAKLTVKSLKVSWNPQKSHVPNHYCKSPNAKGKARRYFYTRQILLTTDHEVDWNNKCLGWPNGRQIDVPEPEPISDAERRKRLDTVRSMNKTGVVDKEYALQLMGKPAAVKKR